MKKVVFKIVLNLMLVTTIAAMELGVATGISFHVSPDRLVVAEQLSAEDNSRIHAIAQLHKLGDVATELQFLTLKNEDFNALRTRTERPVIESSPNILYVKSNAVKRFAILSEALSSTVKKAQIDEERYSINSQLLFELLYLLGVASSAADLNRFVVEKMSVSTLSSFLIVNREASFISNEVWELMVGTYGKKMAEQCGNSLVRVVVNWEALEREIDDLPHGHIDIEDATSPNGKLRVFLDGYAARTRK